MPVTQRQLDSFHRFASQMLNNGGTDLSLEELVAHWRAQQERADVNACLRQATDDLKAGRHRPAHEVMEELRTKHNLPTE